MFIDILKESLRLMKKNLNLTQLIFLFFILIMIFLPVIASNKINLRIIPMIIIFYGIICAFFSGIFFAFKKSLEYEKNPPISNNPYDLPPLYFSEFAQGISLYIKKFLPAGIVVIGLLALILLGFNYITDNFIGIPQKFIDAVHSNILFDNTKVTEFFNSLSQEENITIIKLGIFTLFSMCLYGYLVMLYPVSLVSEEKNFLLSFLISLKMLLKNIPLSLALFIFFNIFLAFAKGIGVVFVNSTIMFVISVLLQCYLNTWYILGLFVYYEKTK